MVQVVPALHSLFKENQTFVFNIDEEKTADKNDPDLKNEKKDYPSLTYLNYIQTNKTNIAIHLAEKIYPFPCLEKLTPPPNFC